mmetsp:Transcript_89989/g.279842  ORF Transcript_89989/g.279842 Transcript_89989/m.279842 type:complete len:213 (-) Transcript_89989:256-894(-)
MRGSCPCLLCNRQGCPAQPALSRLSRRAGRRRRAPLVDVLAERLQAAHGALVARLGAPQAPLRGPLGRLEARLPREVPLLHLEVRDRRPERRAERGGPLLHPPELRLRGLALGQAGQVRRLQLLQGGARRAGLPGAEVPPAGRLHGLAPRLAGAAGLAHAPDLRQAARARGFSDARALRGPTLQQCLTLSRARTELLLRRVELFRSGIHDLQ